MTEPRDPSFLALQRALAGRFSLERELGRGGMGVVYLARDVVLERPVAIKLLAPLHAAREEMRRRFLREARIAAQCFHPHIVPIHEVAEEGELAWFVMAYVPGETLADRLRRVGPLPEGMLVRLAREVGWALAYAHERGVVHRDVKPENILLEAGSDRALIADFGIAWHDPAAAGAAAASGEVMGTARFMAPEQAMGEALDGRADLYALGVTLHLAATGHLPFDGPSAMAVVLQQVAARAPSVRARAPRLGPTLTDAIDRCLEARPEARFPSAAAFVAALDAPATAVELSPEVRAVHEAARGTGTVASWTLAISTAGALMVLGETAGGFGRALMVAIVQSVSAFAGIVTAVRAGEALWEAHRALKAGRAPEDVAEALAPAVPMPPRGRWMTALLGAVAGGALAYGQAAVERLDIPFAVLEGLLNAAAWIVPTFALHRSGTFAWLRSGAAAWLRTHVRAPLARLAVRLLGGRAAPGPARAIPASAPTEVLVAREVGRLMDGLPSAVREALPRVTDASAMLAAEIEALRGRERAISGELRTARAMAGEDRSQRVATLEHAREVARARLGTAMAALESIRLELLRLHADAAPAGGMTEQLEVLAALRRHVDAVGEVERALQREAGRPAPTPA